MAAYFINAGMFHESVLLWKSHDMVWMILLWMGMFTRRTSPVEVLLAATSSRSGHAGAWE